MSADEKLKDEDIALLAPIATNTSYEQLVHWISRLQEVYKDLVADRTINNKQIRELLHKVDAQEGQIQNEKRALQIALNDAAKYKLKWEIETERFDQLIDKMIGERR